MRRSLSISGFASASCVALALSGLFGAAAIANDRLIELAKDPENYAMPGLDYTADNYSTMDQINTGNVKDLRVAWSFSTGLLT